MYAKTAFILITLAGCISYNQGLYRSPYGNWLTFEQKNRFHYEDVIPVGHWDLYVYADGTYTESNDTLFFTYTYSNNDSLYHNGIKHNYELPAFVIRYGKGFLMQLSGSEPRVLKQY